MARTGTIAALGASAFVLAGCLGPTYGTDKPAMEQLFDDLSGSLALGKKERVAIDYKPRPDLVKPADTSTLPEPQQNIAEASPEWPESPEERLARIKAEVDEGRYLPNLAETDDPDNPLQRNARPVASAGQRVYLTDPPSEYRKPAETAPYGDLGPTESAKERARKKASAEPKTGLRRLFPWL
ncbi:hypothetical protein HTY61_12485 [Oricola thermophila]|uniref:DUF3035 domain-containing protein n=1 Tax=Oricola thermophila TaxID=2742145 RepID=A0A6N1VID4_9HYPH|nr:hypothetical protein HTY61_12485 [Oricola thermophila]